MIFWFIVIKPPKQIQRLVEVSLIELPVFKVQEQLLPPPELEQIKPKMVRARKEIRIIPPVTPPVQQNYQKLFNRDAILKPKQIVEQPIKLEKPSSLLVEQPINRVEEKHDISLPVAHSVELPKEDAMKKGPLDIAPSPPLPHFTAKGSSIQIEGLGSRKAKYQPMFKLPSSIEEKGVSLSGSLKFWVSSDGSIDRVEIIKTFGYSEVDSLACAAVYRWRFKELEEEQGDGADWGIVRFRIQLN